MDSFQRLYEKEVKNSMKKSEEIGCLEYRVAQLRWALHGAISGEFSPETLQKLLEIDSE